MDLIAGTNAFITGGAGGIGLAIGQALLDCGARVAFADIDRAELDRAIPRLGNDAMPIELDVTDRDGWRAAREAAEARYGPIDVLVNNAGIGPDGHAFADMEPAAFDRTVAINLTGVFNGIRCFVPGMRERGRGHVVNTASMAGLTATARLGAYTATKFAVVGMSEVLRSELKDTGVGVSVLCPGLIASRLGETTRASGIERAPDMPAAHSAEAMDPRIAAQDVLRAICENRATIVTHGEYRPFVERRMQRILVAFDDVPDSKDRSF